MNDIKPRILVVDDDDALRSIISRALSRQGYDVVEAPDGRRGMAQVDADGADLVITDILMPVMEGIEFIDHLRREHPTVPVVAMSGGGMLLRSDCLRMARLMGARGTLNKPFDIGQLLEVVAKAMALPAQPARAVTSDGR